jgi:protein-tyrosine phosphatase
VATAKRKFSILMVCMGNICRSPTAEAVLRHMLQDAELADAVHIDSAGTLDYHVGEPPDARSSSTRQSGAMTCRGCARGRSSRMTSRSST